VSDPIPDHLDSSDIPAAAQELTGFSQFSFASAGIGHVVYYGGERHDPPLLLMPEISGLSPGLIGFAERLIAARYQVYLPWLFGPFGERAPRRNVLKLCISREFANLRAGVSSPITAWLRALAEHISAHNSSANVGAIGMCLTGAFAIPLVLNPKVTAAVAAQPSISCSLLFASLGIREPDKMRALNVSEEEIVEARRRLESGTAHLLAVRCRPDRICPAEKLERLRELFPVGLETREYYEPGDRNSLGQRPHATFTKEFRLVPNLERDRAPADYPARRAFADLVSFFDRHLREG
jgi:dienelactone hydrolase